MIEEISFPTDDGLTLRGWLRTPESGGQHPVVVMTQGAGGHKEWMLPSLAETLASNGIASVAYDHRNFGASDSTTQWEIDPPLHIKDYRAAITFASTLSVVNPDRIGIWGTSLSGGLVLVVAAIDRRVKAVVSQVPFVSGYEASIRQYTRDGLLSMRQRWDADRLARFHGKEPETVPHFVDNPEDSASGGPANRIEFFQQLNEQERRPWANKITLRSLEQMTDFETGPYLARISPTPLLMIVSQREADIALPFYERAYQPKDVLVFEGDHYDPYMSKKELVVQAANDWFQRWLNTRP